jgi:hypothetical protein
VFAREDQLRILATARRVLVPPPIDCPIALVNSEAQVARQALADDLVLLACLDAQITAARRR